MTVEVYKGTGYRNGQERRAFGEFVQDMLNSYGDSDELFFIIGELKANAGSMDLLLLHSKAIIIADYKELTAAASEDGEKIHLRCKQNGPWQYILGNGSIKSVGGTSKHDSPYDQLFRIRHEFADWLADRSGKIFGDSITHDRALDRLSAWAIICPAFDGDLSDLDLPWDEIKSHHNWFKVFSEKRLAWEFNCAIDYQHHYSEVQLREIILQLGVTRCDLAEILPVPPPHRDGFIKDPPVCRGLIDRIPEKEILLSLLDDGLVRVISIRGLGGVGKTFLAAWMVAESQKKDWRVYWVDCAEKDVTDESFLAAVAGELQSRTSANYILDKEHYSLNDRLQAAVEMLSKRSTLIFFDNFQKVSHTKSVDTLLSYIVQHSEEIKIVLMTRDRPVCLENPRWYPGASRDVLVQGFPYEFVHEFMAADLGESLSPEQCRMVFDRTSGNPYAMRLLISLVQKYSWGERVNELPLFNGTNTNETEQWFASLLDTISDKGKELAFKLSVCRLDLTDGLIKQIHHNPDDVEELMIEIRNSQIVQEVGSDGRYAFHEFIRDYLYERLNVDRKRKAHEDAGKYYEHAGAISADEITKAEYYNEAVYHFEKADKLDDVLRISCIAFELFLNSGDWDRAKGIASIGLRSAQGNREAIQIGFWLTQIASWELDHDQFADAGKHLHEALKNLPKVDHKTPEAKRIEIQRLNAQIYLQKGRLAYYQADFSEAADHFDQALELAKLTGDPELEAESLVRIGRIERQKAQYERAEQHFKEASVIAETIQDPTLLIESISHMGLLARKRGDFQAAQQSFELAYQKSVEANDRRAIEINLSLLGDLARRSGDYRQAEKIFRECLGISRILGNGLGIRINLGQLAESLIYLGEYQEAEQLLGEVQQRCEKVGDGVGIAWTYRRQGLLLKVQGEIDGGNQLIQKGIAKLVEIGNEDYLEDFHKALGPIQLGLFVSSKSEIPSQPPLPGF